MEVTFVETPVMGGSGPCSSLDWEDLGGHSALKGLLFQWESQM